MMRILAVLLLCFNLTNSAKAESQIGLNLAPITDWSTQVPFLDIMKTARPWIVHHSGQWGGSGEKALIQADVLDKFGWPTRKPRKLGTVGTVILTDMPEEADTLAGRYLLRFEGQGIVEVSGRATNVKYGAGNVTFDYIPGPGLVEIRIQRSNASDYVRNISVVKAEYVSLFDSGEIFNPDWLAQVNQFAVFRFMDWMATNNSVLSSWSDRPLPDDYTYARDGVPIEIMMELLRKTGRDGWFTLPHKADDDYMRRFAEMVSNLPKDTEIYVEYSNEMWNWQFAQTQWADEQASLRWGQAETGPQFYGARAAEMAMIWRDVFEENESSERLVTVISSQTGWLGLEEMILEAPLWQTEKDSPGSPPWVYFDAYAVTGYFGGVIGLEDNAPTTRQWIADSLKHAEAEAIAQGLSGSELETYVETHRFDLASEIAAKELRNGAVSGNTLDSVEDLMTRVLPYHKDVAEEHGLEMIMYEGGSHVVGIGPMVDDELLAEFFMHFNYTTEMGALYDALIEGWSNLGGGAFAAYSDVYAPSKWGSWGAQRWLGDENPRWQALKGAL